MYNFIKGFEGAYNWAGAREGGREGGAYIWGAYNQDKKCILKCVNRDYFNTSLILTIHTEVVSVQDMFSLY